MEINGNKQRMVCRERHFPGVGVMKRGFPVKAIQAQLQPCWPGSTSPWAHLPRESQFPQAGLPAPSKTFNTQQKHLFFQAAFPDSLGRDGPRALTFIRLYWKACGRASPRQGGGSLWGGRHLEQG